MDERYRQLPDLFPEPLQAAVAALLEQKGSRVEELRFRNGVAPAWVTAGRELPLHCRDGPLLVTPTLLEEIVHRASAFSAYAVQEQLCAGFLTLSGGHRLGICGWTVARGTEIQTIRNYQALNLRLAGERPGCAEPIYACLQTHPGSALILGPPRAGKTTVLRDLVRQLSDRGGQRVGLVDERGELAACRNGVPQLQVGSRTDVLSACPKAVGIEMLVRSMSPDWIAVDEITAACDVQALARAACCGVRFLATAHADGISDLKRRPVYRMLLALGVFEQAVVIRRDRSLHCERMNNGTIETCGVWDDPDGLLLCGDSRGAAPA